MEANTDFNKTIELLRPDGSKCNFAVIPEDITSWRRMRCYIRNMETGQNGVLKYPTYFIDNMININGINALPYGEVIATEIAKKVDIPVCAGDFGFININGFQLPASISYFDLSIPSEELLMAPVIENWYQSNCCSNQTQGAVSFSSNCQSSNESNIPFVIASFYSYLMHYLSPESIQAAKQSIIDMIMFDCKFGNPDRNKQNYGLGIMNDGTKAIRFYPPFDNEGIFYFGISDIHIKNSKGNYESIIASLKSKFCFEESRRSMPEVVRDLFLNYPNETQIAYRKVTKFSREDFERLLDKYEDLSKGNPLRRDLSLAIFDYLDRELGKVYESINVEKDHSL